MGVKDNHKKQQKKGQKTKKSKKTSHQGNEVQDFPEEGLMELLKVMIAAYPENPPRNVKSVIVSFKHFSDPFLNFIYALSRHLYENKKWPYTVWDLKKWKGKFHKYQMDSTYTWLLGISVPNDPELLRDDQKDVSPFERGGKLPRKYAAKEFDDEDIWLPLKITKCFAMDGGLHLWSDIEEYMNEIFANLWCHSGKTNKFIRFFKRLVELKKISIRGNYKLLKDIEGFLKHSFSTEEEDMPLQEALFYIMRHLFLVRIQNKHRGSFRPLDWMEKFPFLGQHIFKIKARNVFSNTEQLKLLKSRPKTEEEVEDIIDFLTSTLNISDMPIHDLFKLHILKIKSFAKMAKAIPNHLSTDANHKCFASFEEAFQLLEKGKWQGGERHKIQRRLLDLYVTTAFETSTFKICLKQSELYRLTHPEDFRLALMAFMGLKLKGDHHSLMELTKKFYHVEQWSHIQVGLLIRSCFFVAEDRSLLKELSNCFYKKLDAYGKKLFYKEAEDVLFKGYDLFASSYMDASDTRTSKKFLKNIYNFFPYPVSYSENLRAEHLFHLFFGPYLQKKKQTLSSRLDMKGVICYSFKILDTVNELGTKQILESFITSLGPYIQTKEALKELFHFLTARKNHIYSLDQLLAIFERVLDNRQKVNKEDQNDLLASLLKIYPSAYYNKRFKQVQKRGQNKIDSKKIELVEEDLRGQNLPRKSNKIDRDEIRL